MPHTLWIWELSSCSIVAILVHDDKILNVEWKSSVKPHLATATGSNRIFLWNTEGCSSVPLDAEFEVHDLIWNRTSVQLLLCGPTSFCLLAACG